LTSFKAPTTADHADPLAGLLSRSVQQREPVLARLVSADAFRQRVRHLKEDGTLKQILKLLGRYQELDAKPKSLKSDSKLVSTAALIQGDVERWLEKHSPARDPGLDPGVRDAMNKLQADATTEIARLKRQADLHDEDGTEKLNKRIAAKDIHSAFQRLAPAIDAVVPNSGSKAEIEAEIEFAVDPTMVGYIGLRLKLEADRAEDKKLKTRVELALTGGAKIPNIGRVRLDVGGYLETQAKTAEEVLQLVSYGLYRTARRRRDVPRWFVNKLWGGEWDSDPGYANAERWAGRIETGIMQANPDAYAEAGMMGGAMGEAGFQAGPVAAKAKIIAQAGGGERWDAKGINAVADKKQSKLGWSNDDIGVIVRVILANEDARADDLHVTLKNLGVAVSTDKLKKLLKQVGAYFPNARTPANVEELVRDVAPGQRPRLGEASKEEALFGKQAGRGERTMWFKTAAEADISVATMAMKYERHYKSTGREPTKRGMAVANDLREHKIEGRFGVKLPLNAALGDGLLQVLQIEKAVGALLDFMRTTQNLDDADEDVKLSKKEKASRGFGTAARGSADAAIVLTQLAELPPKAFKWTNEAKSAINPGVFGAVALVVVIDAKFKNSDRSDKKTKGLAKDGVTPKQLQSYEINLQIAEEKSFKFEADLAAVAGRIAAKTQERWLRAQKKDGQWYIDFIGNTTAVNKKAKETVAATQDKKKKAREDKAKTKQAKQDAIDNAVFI
jgi:hypothetical protein